MEEKEKEKGELSTKRLFLPIFLRHQLLPMGIRIR